MAESKKAALEGLRVQASRVLHRQCADGELGQIAEMVQAYVRGLTRAQLREIVEPEADAPVRVVESLPEDEEEEAA